MLKKNEYSEWEYEEEEEEEEEERDESSESEEEDDDNHESDSDNSEVELEIDGKKQKVTLEELKKGYMRQSDYTKKTQELSKKDEKKVTDKAEKIIENEDDYPEEDVKAAKYLISIAKNKFGLMTRDEFELERNKDRQISALDKSFDKLTKEVSKMKGMPKVNQDELLDYMKETGIHNPRAAYINKHEAEYRDFIIKKSKGDKSYLSDKGGKKPEPKSKKIDMDTDEGQRAFLSEEIAKITKK